MEGGMSEDEKTKIWGIMSHYEGMADKSKSRAWSLTTWILTLNSALFAFCIKFYSENLDDPYFLIIELAGCSIGLLLSIFLCFVVFEQGKHLKTYWAITDKIMKDNSWLTDITGEVSDGRTIKFPPFCQWLLVLSGLFILGFIVLGGFFINISICA